MRFSMLRMAVLQHKAPTRSWWVLPLSLTLMGGGLGACLGIMLCENHNVLGGLLGLLSALGGVGGASYSLGATHEHIRVLTQYRLIGEDRPDPIPPWCTKCWIHCAVTEGEFNE